MAEKFTNVADIFEKMPTQFNADAVGDMDATMQFDCTGDDGGIWHAVIKDQTLTVNEGTIDNPTMTLTVASDDMIKMVNGEANAMSLFMMGKLKVAGDMQLALKLQQILNLG